MSAGSSQHAEAVAEGIAAKGDGRAPAAFEFLLAFRAGVHRARQKSFEIVYVKVDMNGRPKSLIAANVVGSCGQFATSRFIDESDLSVTAFEDDVGRHWSGDFGKSQGVALKPQAFVEPRNIN